MAIIILLVSNIPVNAPLKQCRSRKDDKAINIFIQGNMRAPPAVPVEEGAARERCGTNWEGKVIWGCEAMSEYWCHPPPRVHEWPSVTSSEQHCLATQTVTPRFVQKRPAHFMLMCTQISIQMHMRDWTSDSSYKKFTALSLLFNSFFPLWLNWKRGRFYCSRCYLMYSGQEEIKNSIVR